MNRLKHFLIQNKWLLPILMLATFLRCYHIGFQSLWLDEIFTLNISNPALTFDEFNYEMILREGFPYLYFYILDFFYTIFGYSPETARIVSAIGGVLGVYAVYLFTKEVFTKNAGLIAAFLIAINEYNIQISQDARPYSLYLMATVFSFYRLTVFLKAPTLKNAIWYGLFAGLTINFNFFGFINILSQVIIILFFFLLSTKEQKLTLFKYALFAGLIALMTFVPNYKIFLKLLEFKSFWVPAPAPDSLTLLFKQFLGNFEVTLFIFTPIYLHYLFTVFRQKDLLSLAFIKTNKIQFSFVLLFGWAIIFIMFLMIKSYTDISLILARYFTSITPIFAIVLAIGIYLIRNKLVRYAILSTIGIFTLLNLFIVNEYYSKISKTQFREISADIISKNVQNEKVVSSWGWLFNYYLKPTTNKNTIESPLDVYVQDMITEKVDNLSFWYIDANARPYNLNPELEAYLNANFIVDQNIEYYDTWAKHYKSKNAVKGISFLTLNNFKPSLFDGSGAMIFVENMASTYPTFNLPKGEYQIIVKGISLPEKPLNGVNAHFKVIIDDQEVGSFFLSNEAKNDGSFVTFENPTDKNINLQLVYDNDEVVNTIDRNAIINSIQIKKK